MAAQAYALGATHVLFKPVDRKSLLAALADPNHAIELSAGSAEGADAAASAGAASIASMFSAVLSGRQIDVADAKHAAGKIAGRCRRRRPVPLAGDRAPPP